MYAENFIVVFRRGVNPIKKVSSLL